MRGASVLVAAVALVAVVAALDLTDSPTPQAEEPTDGVEQWWQLGKGGGGGAHHHHEHHDEAQHEMLRPAAWSAKSMGSVPVERDVGGRLRAEAAAEAEAEGEARAERVAEQAAEDAAEEAAVEERLKEQGAEDKAAEEVLSKTLGSHKAKTKKPHHHHKKKKEEEEKQGKEDKAGSLFDNEFDAQQGMFGSPKSKAKADATEEPKSKAQAQAEEPAAEPEMDVAAAEAEVERLVQAEVAAHGVAGLAMPGPVVHAPVQSVKSESDDGGDDDDDSDDDDSDDGDDDDDESSGAYVPMHGAGVQIKAAPGGEVNDTAAPEADAAMAEAVATARAMRAANQAKH